MYMHDGSAFRSQCTCAHISTLLFILTHVNNIIYISPPHRKVSILLHIRQQIHYREYFSSIELCA